MGRGLILERNITFEDWQGLKRVHQMIWDKSLCEQIIAYMNYWDWDATG